MKKISKGIAILLAVCILCSVLPFTAFAAGEVKINEMTFPDSAFRSYVQSFDTDGDGVLSQEEIDAVESIDVSNKKISSLDGIDNFPNVVLLKCNGNNLTELDVSGLKNLKTLYCNNNSLVALNVIGLENLTTLYCQSNELEELNLISCTALKNLNCQMNMLYELDLSSNMEVTVLKCFSNKLRALDVSDHKLLLQLYCDTNYIEELDVSGCASLDMLSCFSNKLTELDITGCTSLTALRCSDNQLTSLDLSKNKNLTDVSLDQAAKLNPVQSEGKWILDMNEIVPNVERVSSLFAGYDAKTGVVTFDTLPASWSYTYSTGMKNYKMNVQVSFVNEHEIVASAGEGGYIFPSGTTVIKRGESQTYTFTPEEGYKFSKLIVDGKEVLSVNSYTFNNVNANHTIEAVFALMDYKITATAGLGGTISNAGVTTVTRGDSITYTITPNNKYIIADVKVDGVSKGAVDSYTFPDVTADHKIAVTFGQPTDKFTITAESNFGGFIRPSGKTKYAYGEDATYTFRPTSLLGYEVSDVIVDGKSIGAVDSYTFKNITENHTIRVEFSTKTVKKQYKITVSSNLGGEVEPNGFLGVSTVVSGEPFEVSFVPNDRHYIADVTVDGVSVGAVTSWKFDSVDANHTIHVTFERESETYMISASAGFGGTITPNGVTSVSPGENKYYKIVPNDGYVVKEVTVDNVSIGPCDTYTFENVSASHTINVTFKKGFTDINSTAYYYKAVLWAVNNGITSGTSATTFSPDMKCSRGQVVTFLWRAMGEPEPETQTSPFTDVKASAYYYKAVLWAYETGITAGTSKTTFSPDADVSRGQFLTFLWRAQGKPETTGANPFLDCTNQKAYYYKAVMWAYSEKIASGTSANAFSPDAVCPRAQVVTFLYRTLKK